MLTCHVDPPLNDGVLVGSHWVGGLLQLPRGDTQKLLDRVETDLQDGLGAEGPGLPPPPCQETTTKAGRKI